MEVSGRQLTKYISGGTPLSTGCLMDGQPHFIFLILTLAAAQQVFKNTMQGTMHLMQWQLHGTVTDTVNSLVRFLQNPSEGMLIHATENKILLLTNDMQCS